MSAIQLHKMLLPDGTLDQAKFLLGFDYDGSLYHVIAFDFGDDGGAIGIWKEGDEFCARISLDAMAEFNAMAKAEHIVGNG